MKTEYKFHGKFVFRTPLISLQKEITDVTDFLNYTRTSIFKEAIYLASPVLYGKMIKWHNKGLNEEPEESRLINSLFKYYSRMRSRCTPFGLFASCSCGEWDNENTILISDSIIRHTRLDMEYLSNLFSELSFDQTIQPFLTFYVNNSSYALGDEFRYIEYKHSNGKRLHSISSVAYTEYLKKVINFSKEGIKLPDLSKLLVDEDITKEQAENYVDELVKNQVLISELEPKITGEDLVYQLINSLKTIKKSSPKIISTIQLLESVQFKIHNLDKKPQNDTDKYEEIEHQLIHFNVPIVKNHLFQTDIYRDPLKANLDKQIQNRLLNAFNFLKKIAPKEENPNLKIFKDNFYKRYEDAEVSLLKVLDTESGIGYTIKDSLGDDGFLDDFKFQSRNEAGNTIFWNPTQYFLLEKLIHAANTNSYTISFKNEDLAGANESQNVLPDTIDILFSLVKGDKIHFKGGGGSSGANLLGRFAKGDHGIRSIIDDITELEKKNNIGKIVAEIVHLPEGRTGNVLMRPVLREYELSYLGKASVGLEGTISIQDLAISLKNNRIILRSKKLNKEIIPKLTTAHNYSFNSVPVYQFLCDMQTQDFEKSSFGFNWGVLSQNFKFLPRAEFEDVILERATWQFSKSDIIDLKKLTSLEEINHWRNIWRIPERVVLVEGDNELLIEFNNPLSFQMFIHEIRKKDRIVIKEFLFDTKNSVIKDKKEKTYTNEFIAILLKENATGVIQTDDVSSFKKTKKSIPKDFSLGSDWLYYKLYCGVKTQDKILLDVIKPLADKMVKTQWIDKFFFIRYNDPDSHIRVRFHINKKANLSNVINKIYKAIKSYFDNGLINKIQTETYKRELNRYGSNSMVLSETLFYIDSDVILRLMSALDFNQHIKLRWQFAILSVNALLNDFQFSLDEKLSFIGELRDQFMEEHGKSSELKEQLNRKYRFLKKEIEMIFSDEIEANSEYSFIKKVINLRTKNLKPIVAKILLLKKKELLQVSLNDLIASYLHMSINRIFISRQRTYELVLYDFLFNHFKSVEARKNNEKP
ncbi:MAG TPA: lantibiotic dehydratase [Flavobacteriales bacterium]|nr:lantibiotic dehydratase [Flavobacteriales bacterium]